MTKNLSNLKLLFTIVFIVLFVLITLFIKMHFLDNRQVSRNLNNLFFKNLNVDDTIEKIKKININHDGQKLTLIANEENKWLITEKYNFPALNSKVKEIIFGLADLKIIEPKTSRPENFAELQLQDLDINKGGTKIALLDVNDKEIDSIYIGKRDFVANSHGDYRSHIFIRRPSQHQTWLVSGRLPESFAFKDLVFQPAIPIELANITEVTLIKPKRSNDAIKISRNLSTGELKLLEIPPRYKMKDQYMIDNILQQISYLNYEDIMPNNVNALKVLEVQVVVVKNSKVHPNEKDLNLKEETQTLKYNFDLVYLNNNYYLKYSRDNSIWLYKISDYAFQSLLIEKKDLLTLMNK